MARPFLLVLSDNVRSMLTGAPDKPALRRTIDALDRLRADIAQFAPWPALEASLARDAQALRARLEGAQ